ncbi:hypothetical protein [uncultured Clostridium sp.]|nr:hypothetical protein [uncultured Clostridium sp.]
MILDNNAQNYEDDLVNLCIVLATFVYYVEFNEENSVRQLDTI